MDEKIVQDVPESQKKKQYSREQILEWRRQKEERMRDITRKLETGVRDVFSSGRYEEWLNTMSKFHRYSVNNQILINMQKPDAHFVAGYTDWERKFSRHVKKGETGIRILAPTPYKKKTEEKSKDPVTGETIIEEKEVMMPAYKIATVFDYSQTEGEPLPTLGVSELEGKIDDYSSLRDALMETAKVPISFKAIQGTTKGYYSLESDEITVKEGMSQVQTVKTMIHEMAHSERPKPEMKGMSQEARSKEEVIAESVAFVVSKYYGLSTDDYSFGYIAGWSADKDIKELKFSLEEIRQMAHGMIERIDEKILSRSMEKEKTVEKQQDTIKVYYKEQQHRRSR